MPPVSVCVQPLGRVHATALPPTGLGGAGTSPAIDGGGAGGAAAGASMEWGAGTPTAGGAPGGDFAGKEFEGDEASVRSTLEWVTVSSGHPAKQAQTIETARKRPKGAIRMRSRYPSAGAQSNVMRRPALVVKSSMHWEAWG